MLHRSLQVHLRRPWAEMGKGAGKGCMKSSLSQNLCSFFTLPCLPPFRAMLIPKTINTIFPSLTHVFFSSKQWTELWFPGTPHGDPFSKAECSGGISLLRLKLQNPHSVAIHRRLITNSALNRNSSMPSCGLCNYVAQLSGFKTQLIKGGTATITQGMCSEGAWNYLYRTNPSSPNSEARCNGFRSSSLDRARDRICGSAKKKNQNSPHHGGHPYRTVPLPVWRLKPFCSHTSDGPS